jgi:hypothetical protein
MMNEEPLQIEPELTATDGNGFTVTVTTTVLDAGQLLAFFPVKE